MNRKVVGVFAVLLCCAALAVVQGVQHPNQVAALAQATQTNLKAYEIEATKSFIGTELIVPNPGNSHNTNIHMSDGLISIYGGAASEAQQGSGWSAEPDVQLHAYQGTAIYGHFTVLNYGRGPGLDLAYCTGLNNAAGFQRGCDTANNSSDSVGEIWLTGGASGGATQGTVQVVFGGTPWPSDPYCQLTVRDEFASWAPGATVKGIAPLGGRTRREAFTVAWDNNGVKLPNGLGGPGLGIQYFCVAAP